MSLTLVSWNLKGSKGVDVRAVVDHVEAMGADVLMLQEVQPCQARAIARSLGAKSRRWGFKHWPIRTWPEGMAVIGVTQPAPARTHAITHRRMPWSWRRRILQVATVRLDAETGPGLEVTLVNVHLSSGDAAAIRAIEAGAVVRRIAERGRQAVVAGDFNDLPAADLQGRFRRRAYVTCGRSSGATTLDPPTGGAGYRGRPSRRRSASTTCSSRRGSTRWP